MKAATIFICSSCDSQALKWSGRCIECGKWGTLAEHNAALAESKPDLSKQAVDLKSLAEVGAENKPRFQTGIDEFDQVLGGGIVQGSLILLGGDPGIGKSTLSLQILPQDSPLYVSGEESGQQVKMRADRLAMDSSKINFLSQTNVETIIGTIEKNLPTLVVIDSVQTIYSSDVESEPGSVTQVRACTVKLLEAAKKLNIPIILIGHVTKEGQVAGPRTLEHLVDTVLYLEGDRFQTFRILRTVKNRFGATNEVGIFEMTSRGLQAVANPSQLFISESEKLPGAVLTCTLEGTRPLLVEIQALVTKSAYGTPQRRASGYDVNRLQLLMAVLSQRTKLDFSSKDVHLNVVGGLRIQDPACDLAVCAAIISALQDKSFDQKALFLGEVGLSGEVRSVRLLSERLKEAKKLGFEYGYIPAQKTKALMEIKTISSVGELLSSF